MRLHREHAELVLIVFLLHVGVSSDPVQMCALATLEP